MIKINSLLELDNYLFENFLFKISPTEIIIENKKEKCVINIEFSLKKQLKAIETIEKLTNLKIKLNAIPDEEILSFIENKGFSKTLWNPIGKAMHEYNMIEEGDRVAVGVSGGKDSLTVLNALIRIKKISKVNFEIFPIHIHPVEEGSKYEEIEDYCKNLGYPLQVFETTLGDILFDKTIKNPCFLCARIRRGLLYRVMKEQNINKLALGHHKDDIVETFLLNVFYQGNMNVMKPMYSSEEYGVSVIRPLAYVEEKDTIKYAKKLNLPILINECPYETSDNSRRLKVKNIIKAIGEDNPEIRSVILNSIKELLD
ncbi:tRNA(Ile)-lysidine synthase TilS/MesJ [Cetobacterium ceti]|uniref:tRNA(Ile)-lysidine synthase TilS/MesJ n=1 Tax=Cetobacterium ceti TaxID=180163 RepID=A0A1T4JV09_9FUSO|nr:ATP-binding protein [Cetobacterium ceti]SJZ34006.1 tRNA(Ile)-lysidine synthase TilS/MesJ [Cetobacterium ceti]